MLQTIRGLLKIPFFIFIVSGVALLCFLWKFLVPDLVRRRRFYVKTVSMFSRLGLWLMNAEINVFNEPPDNQHYFLVGNHQGMLDILVLAADHPSLFITSVDLRETPFLGTLAEIGGCLFVERRNRHNILNEMLEIRRALQQGLSVILFPEGTSTNGERILPFKKTLVSSAAGTGIPIKPFVINYRSVNGEPMSDKWRDYVCWYGDIQFYQALWRMLTVRSVKVDLEYFPEVIIHTDEQRREIVTQIQALVESKFTPIVKPL
jgi:1-acyl-sn-glycerol-3-phosphate acyltransferase